MTSSFSPPPLVPVDDSGKPSCKAYGYARRTHSDLAGEEQSRAAEGFYSARLAGDGFAWAGTIVDDVETVKVPFLERPGGARLGSVLSSGDVVVIPVSIRAFVGIADLFSVTLGWSERGVRHHLLDLGLDLDHRLWPLASAATRRFTEVVSADHGELLRGVMAKRKQRGQPTGKSPYGFKAVGPFGRRRWVPDRKLRAFGARVVAMRAAGRTWESMYFEFLYGGVRRRDGGEWSIAAIRRVFDGELKLREQEAAGQPTAPPTPPDDLA